jgi:hypothetical protein
MLTLEQLRDIHISPKIIKKAFSQAEKMLADVLKTKDGINQKLFVLFSGYTPILISIITASFIIAQNNIKSQLLFFMIPLSLFLMISVLFFVASFRGAYHGALGSSPEFWLQEDTVSGNEETLAIVTAYLVHDYQRRIELSIESNIKKVVLQHAGIYLSVIGIVFSFITFLLSCLLSLSQMNLICLFAALVFAIALLSFGCYWMAKTY